MSSHPERQRHHRRTIRDPLLLTILVVVVVDVGSRFFFYDPTQAGLVVSKHSFVGRTTIDGDDDAFENTRMMRMDASCGAAWSRPGLLTGDRTSYSSSKNGSINTTIWSHRRSGAPSATGTIAARISRCIASGDSDGTKIVQRESVLCLRPEVTELQRDHPHGLSNTIIVEFNGNWDDVLGGGDANLNLWHYHAAVFRIWCGVQIGLHFVAAETGDEQQHPNNSTSTIDDGVATNNAPWVVLSLPPPVFARLGRFNQNILVASPARLLEHSLSSSSKSTTPLEGLQSVADAFRGRLMVIRSGATTVTELRAALREVGANPDVEMWIQPPNDGLLWDLAWDRNLASPSNCQNSLLHQYRNDLLMGLGAGRRPRPPNRHMCYMSRQRRNKLRTPDRGNVRNLSPDFLLQLLGRLGSPILLTPSTALRRSPNSGGGGDATTTASSSPYYSRLVQMEHIYIAEQLQYVYDECAVLLGVHGAGLTNALGLRPGTAVIELQSKYKSDYQYFRNVATLLNDVDMRSWRHSMATVRTTKKTCALQTLQSWIACMRSWRKSYRPAFTVSNCCSNDHNGSRLTTKRASSGLPTNHQARRRSCRARARGLVRRVGPAWHRQVLPNGPGRQRHDSGRRSRAAEGVRWRATGVVHS